MKTREEIIKSLQKWYNTGYDNINMTENRDEKYISFNAYAWTEFTRQRIAPFNNYAIVPDFRTMDNLNTMKLLITIYYNS